MVVIGEFLLDGGVLLFMCFSEFQAEYVLLLPSGVGFYFLEYTAMDFVDVFGFTCWCLSSPTSPAGSC